MKYRILATLILCAVLAFLFLDSRPSSPESPKSNDDNTFKSIKIE